jgi:YVTN family beta-propeller protein
MRRWLAAAAACAACGSAAAIPQPPAHSSSIAISPDGATLYVVNADADSVSVIDTASRVLLAEIALGAGPPSPAPDGTYTPAVMPRALAIAPDAGTIYVSGERAGALFAIDATTHAVRSVHVGSEPIGVAVAPDGATIYVACSQDAAIVRVDAATLTASPPLAVDAEPWGLAWSADGALLVTHLLAPEITVIDPQTFAVTATWAIPIAPPRGDRRLAHGLPRGLYDLAARPDADELWLPHLLLGTDTPQPSLDFESTAFPAVSIVRGDGTFRATLSTDAIDVPGIDGAFGDVVSGPHAAAFTPDGALALVVDTNSEDVLAIDPVTDVEVALARGLPGHQPEGIALSRDGATAYIDERSSLDVAVVDIDAAGATTTLTVEPATIARTSADPMPPMLRAGQRIFESANSDQLPVTQDHWLACASCHLEGRSDAVTWEFAQGPRDTPSNAGGMRGTGFLFRTADRSRVQDYWQTIDIEQGGRVDAGAHELLDPLEAYVDLAIPAPIPPTTDVARVAHGAALFARADVGCASCHGGPRFTDSGAGNPMLDLSGGTGPIVLHDVGTCVTSGYADVAHADIAGDPRAACEFDTPSLTGLAASPPYLHDGSAPTLHDVLERTRGTMGDISSLSADDEGALEEYLRSL